MGASIELIGVSKEYKGKAVVRQVYLQVKDGEFLTILGPSGAGKTTVLKMIAGFERTTDGFIRINGENITAKPTYKRNIGMLFQNYALFPHMTVADNIAFPLKIRRMGKAEISRLVAEVLEKVKLVGYEKRYPRELSGGQQQRVALARALVFNPPILLLDEPMAALDKQLRKHMQIEVKQLQRELGITTISVTHDQEEALTMATNVCVMRDGQIAQVARPNDIYEHPNSNFVATFIGEANLLKATIHKADQDKARVNILGAHAADIACNNIFYNAGEPATVMVRPEKAHLLQHEDFNGIVLDGVVTQAVYVGEAVKFEMRMDTGEMMKIKAFSGNKRTADIGERIRVGVAPEDMVLIKNL